MCKVYICKLGKGKEKAPPPEWELGMLRRFEQKYTAQQGAKVEVCDILNPGDIYKAGNKINAQALKGRMKKIKYFYNTNTLRYEKLVTPLRVKLLRIFSFLSAIAVSCLIGLIYLYTKFFPKPPTGSAA